MTVEGVPEGYELVRIGSAKAGDTVITDDGRVYTLLSDVISELNIPVVRKVEPVLDLSKSRIQFTKGWVAQDKDGNNNWYPRKPARDDVEWYEEGSLVVLFIHLNWRSDLDWTQRIFEVK